jgi:rhodanese-related sulfurtransferase
MDIKSIINQKGATLIDVREIHEFESGHAIGAINIPLSIIQGKVDDILNLSSPIILYCRSGMRSGQALEFLRAMGVQDVYNAGGVEDVLAIQNS